jgi:hypothetical protein
VGAGTAYKLMINMIGAVQIASLAEGLALAEKAGLDLSAVVDALQTSQAASPQVSGSSAIPRHQVLEDVVDAAWALHRAHVHARRYVCVEGLDPVDVVPRPTWSELRVALDHEMAFLTERNFDISDDAAYAVLNAARVLVSHRTRDVAISKYACGASLAESEASWRSTLDAALRRYQRHDVPIPDARAFVDWVRGLTAEP